MYDMTVVVTNSGANGGAWTITVNGVTQTHPYNVPVTITGINSSQDFSASICDVTSRTAAI
ncbi:MAG: hypothetical protein R2795_05560 [Saprospiraceae bacterium]